MNWISVYFDHKRGGYHARFRSASTDRRRKVPASAFRGVDGSKPTERGEKAALQWAMQQQPAAAKDRVMGLGEIVSLYVAQNPGQVLPITLKKNQETAAHLVAFFADVPADGITVAAATEYRNARTAEGARNRTIRNELAFLKRLLNFAAEWQDVTGVRSVRLVRLPTIRRDERRGVALTEAQFFAVLKQRPHRNAARVRRILIVGVTTMLRRKALLGLRWEWIDVDRHWLTVPAEHMKGRSGERRPLSVPLCAWTIEALGMPKRTGYVFANRITGGATKTVVQSIRRMAKRAGVPAFTLHDLRRTGTSWLEAHGVNRLARKVLLGHATDVDVTDLYTFKDEGSLRGAVGVFDAIRREHSREHRHEA